MKVNVLQVSQVEFKKFSWWSNWVDIAVFDFGDHPYLLQMRISRTNGKQFNAIQMTGKPSYRCTTCKEIGDLMPMSVEVKS